MNVSKVLSRILLGASVGVLASCGSASNQQGESFTAVGFMATDDEGVCQFDTGVNSLTFSLTVGEDGGSANVFAPCIQMQNNLSSMFVRTDRAYLNYFIEGASVQPPDSISAMSVVVGPGSDVATGGGSTDGGSSASARASTLPTGAQSIAERVVAPLVIVPAEVRSWMSLNRASLPEPPFNMIITATVSGVTSAGDRIETNPLSIGAEVLADVIVPDEIPAEDGGTDSGTAGVESELPLE